LPEATNIRPEQPGRTEEILQIQAVLPFNQSDVSSPRTLLGFLDREIDALTFPKQLEHRAPHGAAMKEMLQAGFIANESKALVD
jgi:hypothetical protein